MSESLNTLPNLLDFTLEETEEFISSLGKEKFRARQIRKCLYQSGHTSFTDMTTISRDFRAKLADISRIQRPSIVKIQEASDGTKKALLHLEDGLFIESVLLPGKNHWTACISTQAGCAMGCNFCLTARQGMKRNLQPSEITGQIIALQKGTAEGPLSRRRVTVSTSGLVPAMDRLAERCPVALAVSLHAPNDALRDQIVPINKKYPLRELMAACRRYLAHAPRDFITFEYVMLAGVNDAPEHARQLIELVREVPCKFNLIPFNPFPDSGYEKPRSEAMRVFREILQDAGLVVTTRKTRGDDIDAACGQLAGKVADKSGRVMKRMHKETA